MKKIFITILSLIYLTVSSGATIHMHYCMGKLESWDLSPKTNGKCGACGMEKAGHKGCCHDTEKQVKIEKDQKISESSFQAQTPILEAVVITNICLYREYISSVVYKHPIAHAPPRLETLPLFVLNCNFRI